MTKYICSHVILCRMYIVLGSLASTATYFYATLQLIDHHSLGCWIVRDWTMVQSLKWSSKRGWCVCCYWLQWQQRLLDRPGHQQQQMWAPKRCGGRLVKAGCRVRYWGCGGRGRHVALCSAVLKRNVELLLVWELEMGKAARIGRVKRMEEERHPGMSPGFPLQRSSSPRCNAAGCWAEINCFYYPPPG